MCDSLGPAAANPLILNLLKDGKLLQAKATVQPFALTLTRPLE